ncbi:MAG: hypothetical protein M1820_004393 [Bogoriella megaspora]|nr:MAG: hypothetical protein M1820_004393 [Bogoriella megaspora]
MTELEKRQNNTVPAPFSFAPAQTWDGNDGKWSTFIIRIGNPPQDFRVLPSTAGQETWVPNPEGCTKSDPSDCGNSRGVQPFNNQQGTGFLTNASSSWQSMGVYDLNFEENLEYETNVSYAGQGLYGFDTVGLQVEKSGGIQIDHQVVAGIALKQFYLGIFGLGVKPANFSSYSNPQAAFLPSAVEQNLIPSKSWGYTAGAPYRLQQVLGSLTLGGYDDSRFEKSNVTFPFGSDDSRSLVVNVLSILAESTLTATANMMSDTILSFIDSSVPEIWLPQDACDQFESHFGLQYDDQTDRYLVNDTIHSQLKQLNPSLTFRLAIDALGDAFQNIVLPYAAFDLQVGYPIYQNPTNYFPIRRAANDTQYTIGRTFLQEAYVIADYDRQQFSVNQATFPASGTLPNEHIVAIHPPGFEANNSTADPTNDKSNGLSGGAIGGIVAGAVVVIALLAGLLWFLRRKRSRARAAERAAAFPPSEKPIEETPNIDSYYPLDNKSPGTELAGSPRHEMASADPVFEAEGSTKPHMPPELHSNSSQRAELDASGKMPGNKMPRNVSPSGHFFELPGDPVSRAWSAATTPRLGDSPAASPGFSSGVGSEISGRSPSPLGLNSPRTPRSG